MNMADGANVKFFSLVDEGCLRFSPYIRHVVYHKSLNVLLAFTHLDQVFVVDIASGTVLHETRFTNKNSKSISKDSLSNTVASTKSEYHSISRHPSWN